MSEVVDRPARVRALDVDTSFIVQAPAGSGKTELLTQRCLALLATVDRPEEVLAITFTRKAAGEMRDRILVALESADEDCPASEPGTTTWRLARRVRERDRELGWQLAEYPGRLKVMTIDAFHALLSKQLPVLSGAGGTLAVTERPRMLYREAARRTLFCIRDDDATGAAARDLLLHLDNNFDRAEEMLVSLLARRDQWLARVTGPGAMDESERREWLEGSLRRQIESSLAIAAAACPEAIRREMPALADYAARNLAGQGASSPILACVGVGCWPPPDAESIPVWQGLAELALTAAGRARKTVTVRQGFPPAGAEEKQAMKAVLELLHDQAGFVDLLAEVRDLPESCYEPAQWRMLDHLLLLLPRCAAELEIVIRERGHGDYVAVADTARRALGREEEPTDLALALDYRIRHILVDEFQDTSAAQVELLRLLTAGWEPGDGRTLFCVGDPMQSIYGFREAEVGLFLDVRRLGRINEVPIESLVLEVNFRSAQGVVEWVNRTFSSVMPSYEDARLGAVPFTAAKSFHPPAADEPVRFHSFESDNGVQEADRVAEVIGEIRRADPAASIAVLVRARSHLGRIAPRLRMAGMRFQAVEIERLADRPVVQDLMALARAISHPADRTAWLACLRAPWCGLTLDDLEIIAEPGEHTICDRLSLSEITGRLTADGRARTERFAEAMGATLAESGRRALHRRVEGAWLALGGPATVQSGADLDDADSFFARLSQLQTGPDLQDPADLEAELDDLFAAPDPIADPDLQLMTIHKAKGLQFDYVLLPGLHRGTSRDDTQLLHWLEVPALGGGTDLLLSVVEERGRDRDPLHRYIRAQENKKSGYELARLLYVAITRARRQVHLFGRLNVTRDEASESLRPPARGTLLELLWESCEESFADELRPPAAAEQSPTADIGLPQAFIRRLPLTWSRPEPVQTVHWATAEDHIEAPREEVEFWWAGRISRAVGTVVHRWLERLAADGLQSWVAQRDATTRAQILRMLAEQGLGPELATGASDKVIRAIQNTLSDEAGRWLLAGPHRRARSEYAVAGLEGHQVVHGVIDRYIVDQAGITWVVDYKTGEHTGGDLDGFLSREIDRYRAQLERYGRLVSSLQSAHELRLGLYFPLHATLRWWRAGSTQSEPW